MNKIRFFSGGLELLSTISLVMLSENNNKLLLTHENETLTFNISFEKSSIASVRITPNKSKSPITEAELSYLCPECEESDLYFGLGELGEIADKKLFFSSRVHARKYSEGTYRTLTISFFVGEQHGI